jgi:hypothetical protein
MGQISVGGNVELFFRSFTSRPGSCDRTCERMIRISGAGGRTGLAGWLGGRWIVGKWVPWVFI